MVDPGELARRLAARREKGAFTCEVCGTPFEALKRKGSHAPRYCSNACKVRAYQQRKKAGAAPDPRPPLPPADLSLIVQTPDVCGGAARVAGTRLTVSSVLSFWHAGHTVEQIREQYPVVTADLVAAAVEWDRRQRGGE